MKKDTIKKKLQKTFEMTELEFRGAPLISNDLPEDGLIHLVDPEEVMKSLLKRK